jgi:hypothetical protein
MTDAVTTAISTRFVLIGSPASVAPARGRDGPPDRRPEVMKNL